jgi:aerobic-type carbon monoxide dehydrogenase small subunit (CoxS/CutS family)
MDETKTKGISRREFLKDAGLVVGGATVGSLALLPGCSKTETITTTVANQTITVTTTAGGSGGATKFVDPIDNTEWASLEELKAHFSIAHPNADASLVAFTVNGVGYAFNVKPYTSLSSLLRDKLALYSVKEGCMLGECGTCTVLIDGVAHFSCMMLAIEMEGRSVQTVEGLSNNGVLSPVQQKFHDDELFQCGWCTPGFIMAAQGLIAANPNPTLDDVRLALSGHLCMCGNLRRTVLGLVGGV